MKRTWHELLGIQFRRILAVLHGLKLLLSPDVAFTNLYSLSFLHSALLSTGTYSEAERDELRTRCLATRRHNELWPVFRRILCFLRIGHHTLWYSMAIHIHLWSIKYASYINIISATWEFWPDGRLDRINEGGNTWTGEDGWPSLAAGWRSATGEHCEFATRSFGA